MLQDGGWKSKEVARAQRELVEKQLQDPEKCSPFAAFLRAVKAVPIKEGMTFLDVGCGVGHYGVLLSRYYPALRYVGLDYSQAMIDEAERFYPSGEFAVRSFEQTTFATSDIVLVAQVLEYQASPLDSMRHVMETAKHYVIFHRLRLTPHEAHYTELEPTYCGNKALNFKWNLDNIRAMAKECGNKVLWTEIWEHNATILLEIAR